MSKLLIHGADIFDLVKWWKSGQNEGSMKEMPKEWAAWENAANRSEFGSIDLLAQDLADPHGFHWMKSVLLEWEIPDVLNEIDPTRIGEDEAPWNDLEHNVVLVRHAMSENCRVECTESIQATAFRRYFEEHFGSKQYDFVVELLDLAKQANLSPFSQGMSPILKLHSY